MKRKLVVGILIAAMAVTMLSGCGLFKSTDKNSQSSEKNTEMVTETEDGEEINTESQGSSESESQVATNDATNQNSETNNNNTNNTGNSSENKPVEPEKPAHTCSFTSLKTDASNHWYACSCGKTANKGAHGYDDQYDASCNSCGFTRSVPERPAPPAESGNPGNISWNGGDIYLEHVRLSVPTLEEFNKVGLVPGQNNWWTGAEGDKKALSDMNVIYWKTEEFSRELEKQGVSAESVNGFTVSQGAIWWSWNTQANEAFKLLRYRENGYYELTINMSLKDAPYGNWQLADWNKDIVRYLCTIVSSEPETLYKYIYTGLHEDAKVLNTSKWKTVGDCQVKFSTKSYATENGFHCVFYIKGI